MNRREGLVSSPERKRLSRAGLESVFLHAVLAAGFFWHLHRSGLLEAVVPGSRSPGPISVALRGGHRGHRGHGDNGEDSRRKESRATGKRADRSESKARYPLDRLGPVFALTPGGSAGASDPPGSRPGGSGGGGQGGPVDGYDTANAMSIQEEGKLYPFFSALWRNIDSITGYPHDLVRERIQGYVAAQVEIDRRGVFTGTIVSVRSDQPVLEAYALAILLQALSKPLPRERWSDRERTVLVARFDFKTFTYGEVPPAREQAALKNVLAFERYGYTDPRLKQEFDRVVSEYAPLMACSLGLYIDVVSLYRLIQNLRDRHKMRGDGLRLERIELSREQWQGLVRRAGGDQEEERQEVRAID